MGALNLDLIASASKLSRRLAENIAESTARFEWNVEGTVEDDVIQRVLERLGPTSIDGALGGSAWNTIYALAHMRVGIRVGYVGVAGRTEFPGLSFVRQMDLLGIDRQFVRHSPQHRCGRCLSYIDDGERILLTHPGANLEMGDHIARNFSGLLGYLSDARAVHVTSLLDEPSSSSVANLLDELRHRNPETIVSVDPGHVWATNPNEAVFRILRSADYLILNHREFKALGGYEPGETDEVVADRVFDRLSSACTLLVAKRYDLAEVFRGRGSRMTVVSAPTGTLGPEGLRVEDATGAGDTFAAGLLASLTSTKLQAELGSSVGLALSRHKLAGGTLAHTAPAPTLASGFLMFPRLTKQEPPPPERIFLAHGRGTEWGKVRDFLVHDCGLDVETTADNDVTDAEGNLTGASSSYADGCGFAVCILADSGPVTLSGRASQEVVQQAGFFHGKYGFSRVALLVEEGCEVLSNVAGLVRLDYPRGHIDQAFWQLARMLRREGILTDHAPAESRSDGSRIRDTE